MFDTIIADEATRISNPKAKQSKLIKQIPSKNNIALTGTPLNNSVQDLWNIMDFCQPGLLGNYYAFTEKYCVKDHWGTITGYKNLNELKNVIDHYMIRRLKADVLTELPDKICENIYIDFSSKERQLYNAIRQEITTDLKKYNVNHAYLNNILVKMTRLKQSTSSLELISDMQISSKLDVLKELLQDILHQDKKAIIFTQFANMAKIIHRELTNYQPLLLIGETDKNQRQQNIIDFNNNNINKLIIMTTAGEFGVNLQRANFVIHYDLPWSISKIEQREGRAHRIGQKNNITVFNLLMSKTIDEYVLKILHKKQKLARELLGDKEQFKKVKITKRDVKKLLGM